MITSDMNQYHDWPAGFHIMDRHDPLTGKRLLTCRHVSGMTVKFLPYPGFSKKFAAVTVPFGSIHTRFGSTGTDWSVPAGTAHFLEHCIFSRDEQGGLAGHLSDLGASANAYTTHDHTLYYFAAVDHFNAALDLWLDALLAPALTEERVAAERPIILAELDQYQDDPDSRCFMQLMDNLYAAHPVRIDIGGTSQSVQAITQHDLQLAWQHFYHPGRLCLTIAGDLDLHPVLQSVATWLEQFAMQPASQARLILPAEPARPVRSFSEASADLAVPLFLVGVKDPGADPDRSKDGYELAMRQRAARLVLDTLLSPVSPLFESLFARGLINDSFGFHYACEGSYAFLACGGESERPEEAARLLSEGLAAAFAQGIDPYVFEVQKRSAAGDMVRALDAPENSGLMQARCVLLGLDLFDYPAIYDKMDCRQAAAYMQFLGDPACYAATLLHPRR